MQRGYVCVTILALLWASVAWAGSVTMEPMLRAPRPHSSKPAQAPLLPRSTSPTPLLVRDLDAELSPAERTALQNALLENLRRFPELRVVDMSSLRQHIGFARQNGTLSCQLPEQCEQAIREQLAIHYELRLSLVPRADGQLNARLKFIGPHDATREFVESVPTLEGVAPWLANVLPDIIGYAPNVRADEGVVFVNSLPLNADVYRQDGAEPVCQTPCSFAWPAGERVRVRVARADHPPLEEQVSVLRGHVHVVSADLMTRQGELLVDSMPSGATVLLDGQEAGTTPLIRRNILSGEHDVTLRMAPYPEASYRIMVKPDDTTRLRHGFLPENGTLIVDVAGKPTRHRAEIFLGATKVAETTYRADLLPGRYVISVVVPGFRTFEQEITLEAGKEVHVSAGLEPGLAVRPGEQIAHQPDYRLGGFVVGLGGLSTVFGGVLLGLSPKESGSTQRNLLIGGGLTLGLGLAAAAVGTYFLIRPPLREIAITPTVDTHARPAVSVSGRF